jgi:hypothetical protein
VTPFSYSFGEIMASWSDPSILTNSIVDETNAYAGTTLAGGLYHGGGASLEGMSARDIALPPISSYTDL